MIEPTLKYISEPSLTFGSGQTAIDPRDGLMLFGPFDHKRIKGVRNIGIIGSANLRRKMIDYLKRIHGPIVNGDLSIARPNFPGLESTFGISINFDNIIQLDIKQKDIDEYLK